jgi:hypothetical protein
LTGGSELDWFFFLLGEDSLSTPQVGEQSN